MSYGFLIFIYRSFRKLPSDSTRYWLITSNLRPSHFTIILCICFLLGRAASSCPCKLFSLCGERGPLYGRVSWLLVAVVPLGAQGHWGTWASVAAGCGPNTLSGQDLEHRLNH